MEHLGCGDLKKGGSDASSGDDSSNVSGGEDRITESDIASCAGLEAKHC